MFALGISFLYGVAIAASLSVLLVLAASLTLLPALLMFTGGLARTGRVITAAAAVMITVFVSFAAADDRVLKLFGIALATAVFLDAIVIRTVCYPRCSNCSAAAPGPSPAGSTAECRCLQIEPARAAEPTPLLDKAA